MAAGNGERGEAVPTEEGMAGAGEEEDGEENILYDLLVNTEWPPETEVQVNLAFIWRRKNYLKYLTGEHNQKSMSFVTTQRSRQS